MSIVKLTHLDLSNGNLDNATTLDKQQRLRELEVKVDNSVLSAIYAIS